MKYLGSAAGTPPAKRQRTSLGSPHTPITSSPLNTSGIKVAPKTAAECGLDASAQSLLAKRPSSVQGLISLILLVVQWMNEKRRLESIEDIGDLLTQYAAEVSSLDLLMLMSYLSLHEERFPLSRRRISKFCISKTALSTAGPSTRQKTFRQDLH